MKSIKFIFVCVIVIICAVLGCYMFAARFFHLTNGFQYDELYSAATTAPFLPFSFIWREMLLQDVNLPLFNIVLYGWNHVFPYTVEWMHFFSAFLGALAVVAGGVLLPKSVPLLKRFIFVVLLACTPILVAYGTNIRAYSLSILIATVFTMLALHIIGNFERHEKPSLGLWLSFFGVGLVGSYSHYFCTAIFFISCLVVFLYACYYRIGRAWSFWGTAVIFACWLPWLWVVHSLMGGPVEGSEWWYNTPLAGATYQMFMFLFGKPYVSVGLAWVAIIGGVSLGFTYKRQIFKQADIILPLAQIVLLCVVVTVVSYRFNLWMDRYFLPLMPAILLLLAGFFYHLYQRHAVLLVLLPVLLVCWIPWYWSMEYVRAPQYTGLHDAFAYLNKHDEIDRVLVDISRVGYPRKAIEVMLKSYIRPGKKLELIELTKQTAPLAYTATPKVPILMLLCSQLHLIYTGLDMEVEEDGHPLVFHQDTCIYTGHYRKNKPKKEPKK